ncbi:MAG: hypothetical protein M0C28_00100 [Candidatus Moduliflexus flocculans]|nr:hypothetical protein [Candidatus Moduliflexus flocculans]
MAPGASSVLIGYACSRAGPRGGRDLLGNRASHEPQGSLQLQARLLPRRPHRGVRPPRPRTKPAAGSSPSRPSRGAGSMKFDIPGIPPARDGRLLHRRVLTLLDTIPSPNVTEYTLRYPGTARDMTLLQEIGLFDTDPVDVNGMKVAPRDLVRCPGLPEDGSWGEGKRVHLLPRGGHGREGREKVCSTPTRSTTRRTWPRVSGP